MADAEKIRNIMADLPLSTMNHRPHGMLAIRRSEVPEPYQAMVDAWVADSGGRIAYDALFKVHNGTTPDLPGGDAYYVLPPGAFKAS